MNNYQIAGEQRQKHSRADIFRYICEYSRNNAGKMPTFREIKEAFDISSTGTVAYILSGLVNDGFLSANGNSYQVVGSDWLPPLSVYDRLGKLSKDAGAVNMFTERRLGVFQIKYRLFESLPPDALSVMVGQFVPVRVVPMAGRVGLQYTAYSDLFDPVKGDIPFYIVHMTPRNDVWVSKGVYCE